MVYFSSRVLFPLCSFIRLHFILFYFNIIILNKFVDTLRAKRRREKRKCDQNISLFIRFNAESLFICYFYIVHILNFYQNRGESFISNIHKSSIYRIYVKFTESLVWIFTIFILFCKRLKPLDQNDIEENIFWCYLI